MRAAFLKRSIGRSLYRQLVRGRSRRYNVRVFPVDYMRAWFPTFGNGMTIWGANNNHNGYQLLPLHMQHFHFRSAGVAREQSGAL